MTALLRRWPTLRLTPTQLSSRIGRFQWDAMFDLVDAHIARACWSNRQVLEVMVDFWSNHLNVTCPATDVWDTRHRLRRGRDPQARARQLRRHAAWRPRGTRRCWRYLDNAGVRRRTRRTRTTAASCSSCTPSASTSATPRPTCANAARLLTGLTVDDEHRTVPLRPGPARDRRGEGARLHARQRDRRRRAGRRRRYLRLPAAPPGDGARGSPRKLCVRFVGDDPPAALVTGSAKVYLDNDTAIAPVLRALFRSRRVPALGRREDRSGRSRTSSPRCGRSASGRRRPAPRAIASALLDARRRWGRRRWRWHAAERLPRRRGGLGSPPAGTLARWNAHLGLAAGWWPQRGCRRPDAGRPARGLRAAGARTARWSTRVAPAWLLRPTATGAQRGAAASSARRRRRRCRRHGRGASTGGCPTSSRCCSTAPTFAVR